MVMRPARTKTGMRRARSRMAKGHAGYVWNSFIRVWSKSRTRATLTSLTTS
jgi:hypothetical protein